MKYKYEGKLLPSDIEWDPRDKKCPVNIMLTDIKRVDDPTAFIINDRVILGVSAQLYHRLFDGCQVADDGTVPVVFQCERDDIEGVPPLVDFSDREARQKELQFSEPLQLRARHVSICSVGDRTWGTLPDLGTLAYNYCQAESETRRIENRKSELPKLF